jgi:peptide subunit release factor 1 (eRF1)
LISKTGTGNIHSRHRQGGSSQARFARHREKQIETFFTRVCEHCRQTFEPYQCGIDYLALGGARNTLNDFFKQCGYLNTIKAPQFKPAYDIPSPNRRVLQEFIHHIWSSKIYQWKTVNNAINT